MEVLVTVWSRVQRKGLGLGCWVAEGLIDRRLMLQRAWREDSGGLTVTAVSHLRSW